MANLPISGLPAASNLLATDPVAAVSGGVTVKATSTQIVNAALGANPVTATQGGLGVAGTLTGLLYGNAGSPATVATAAQIVAAIGLTYVSNATYASTAGSLTGILGVTSGGTGVATLTGLVYGNGAGNMTAATGAQIVSAIGASAVANATNATTASGLSSTLAVGSGGTGATTLTGLVYGNGASAMTAATGAQIVAAIGSTAVTNATNASSATTAGSATTATSAGTISGGAANQIIYQTAGSATGFLPAPVTAGTVLGWSGSAFGWVTGGGGGSSPIMSLYVSSASASGSETLYVSQGSYAIYTSPTASNFFFNVVYSSTQSLNSVMTVGQYFNAEINVTQGTNPYYLTGVSIDGITIPINWYGGVPSTGGTNSIDTYRFTVMKTADATWVVTGIMLINPNTDIFGNYWIEFTSPTDTTKSLYVSGGNSDYSGNSLATGFTNGYAKQGIYFGKTSPLGEAIYNNVIIGGYTMNGISAVSLTDNTTVWGATDQAPNAGLPANAYVLKTDPSGNVMWQTWINSATVATNANFFQGFGSPTTSIQAVGYAGSSPTYYGLMYALSPTNGAILWQQSLTNGANGIDLQTVCGVTAGTTGFCAGYTLYSSDSTQDKAYFNSYNLSNGAINWEREVSPPTGTGLYSVGADNDASNNLYAVATSRSASGNATWVASLNSSGTMRWQNIYTCSINSNNPSAGGIYCPANNTMYAVIFLASATNRPFVIMNLNPSTGALNFAYSVTPTTNSLSTAGELYFDGVSGLYYNQTYQGPGSQYSILTSHLPLTEPTAGSYVTNTANETFVIADVTSTITVTPDTSTWASISTTVAATTFTNGAPSYVPTPVPTTQSIAALP